MNKFEKAIQNIILQALIESSLDLARGFRQLKGENVIKAISTALTLEHAKKIYQTLEASDMAETMVAHRKPISWHLPEGHLPGEITLEKVGEEVDFALQKFIDERNQPKDSVSLKQDEMHRRLKRNWNKKG